MAANFAASFTIFFSVERVISHNAVCSFPKSRTRRADWELNDEGVWRIAVVRICLMRASEMGRDFERP